jgi:hypothetical protein
MMEIIIIEFISGNPVFNYFASIGFWWSILMVVPMALISLINGS